MKYREIKRIKREANKLVKESPNANVTLVQSIARYGFLSVGTIVGITAISAGSNPVLMTSLQMIALVSLSFVTYFNGITDVSYWSGLTGQALVDYKRGINIQLIINGLIRYGYCFLYGLTTLIPFGIGAWLIGPHNIVSGDMQSSTVVLAMITLLWAFVVVWLVNLFYGFTNIEMLKYSLSSGESRKASRKFVFKHFKSCFQLKMSYIGWNLLGFITIGLIGIYSNKRIAAAYDVYFRKVEG